MMCEYLVGSFCFMYLYLKDWNFDSIWFVENTVELDMIHLLVWDVGERLALFKIFFCYIFI